ncbi:AI-2E family transporter [Noviherbaspirillum pedocola]|uniref:AI-2E family transporter n=1 Tax=Noviherbaspirillum pedocola TaxID=2801341 RepID=A0A934SX13_9BURK|nr:AI-2E family transporter [Noviherbaspirillum pedocola]MBK4737209.1 AI-2E family transporter [Noviherbaspirillum pedocola]
MHPASNRPSPVVLASYILSGSALLLMLAKGLLAALFSGLLVYALVHLMAPVLGRRISGQRARMIAVALLSTLIVAILSGAIWWVVDFFTSDPSRLSRMLEKLADIIESSRAQLPAWLRAHVPTGVDALREMLTHWIREHAMEARVVGEVAGRIIAHVLIGMVIGAMAALYDTTEPKNYKPLAAALHARVVTLAYAFRQIVFAQVRIAALNALFTGIFLLIVLPLAGIHLPLVKTMITVTFVAGLLPVVGNLISNTVLVVVGLSHSLHTAIAALLFLVAIHKLEYFLNAKIIGGHINARAWELLSAMLVLEAVFGIPGVIAAPVFYAYLKMELSNRGLV